MPQCIFCQINNLTISSVSLYEDDVVRVIMDAFPESKGHILVLTKQHYDDIFSIDEKTLCHVSKVAKKIADILPKALNADGIKIVQSNKASAGQIVFHYHMHLVPSYIDQDFSEHANKKESQSNLLSVASLIKLHL